MSVKSIISVKKGKVRHNKQQQNPPRLCSLEHPQIGGLFRFRHQEILINCYQKKKLGLKVHVTDTARNRSRFDQI